MVVAILRLLEMIRAGTAELVNDYREAVRGEGNRQAQALLEKVFEPADVRWRALGMIPGSGLRLRAEFREFDAQQRLALRTPEDTQVPGCLCGKVITGAATPHDCPLFGRTCTPINPIGPCMVSSEGTCQAYFKYARAAGRLAANFSPAGAAVAIAQGARP